MEPSEAVPRTVLVVDDNIDAAQSLAILLIEKGHDVRQAYDARTARLLASQFKPEVVLVDIVMPQVDGIELAEDLRKIEGMDMARIIGVSGYDADHWQAQMAHAGLDGFVAKPISADTLDGILRDGPKLAEGGAAA